MTDVRHRWRRQLKIVLLLSAFMAACSPLRGCAEASFLLAPESRLPKWLMLPAEKSRSDVKIMLTYYVPLIESRPRSATFRVLDAEGHVVASVSGTLQGGHPLTLEPSSDPDTYPSYEIVNVNGIAEVIEHRRADDLFYIVDDENVKRRLGVSR